MKNKNLFKKNNPDKILHCICFRTIKNGNRMSAGGGGLMLCVNDLDANHYTDQIELAEIQTMFYEQVIRPELLGISIKI